MGEVPVGVFWDENGGGGWKPHHPDRFRLPNVTPGLITLTMSPKHSTATLWASGAQDGTSPKVMDWSSCEV